MTTFEVNPFTGLLDIAGAGSSGSVSIGDTIGSGAANRVLYLNSTPVLAQDSIFKFRDTDGFECLSIGATGPFSFARAVLSWGPSDIIGSGFAPAGATSPSAVVNTGDGAGNWSPGTTMFYKIYSFAQVGTQRIYTSSPVVVSLLYPATDSGTISWTVSTDTVSGYRVWISFDGGATYTQARDSLTPTTLIDSNEETWEIDDIEAGNPNFPSFHSYYGYYPVIGGTNVFSVYGNSGYFSNAVGIGTDTPTVKLDVSESSASTTAIRVTRAGGSSLYDAAILVQNVSGSANAGALIESGGPNEYGVLRMAGTRVSTSDYLGVFEFQNRGASGDYRIGMIIGKAGTSSVCGTMEFLTRNTIGFQTAMVFTEDGYVGVGGVAATARLHLPAGAAAANKAPLKFTSGTDLTTAVAGAMEFNGTRLAFSPSTTRKRIQLSNDVAPTDGQLMIGNGTDFTVTSLTAGANITLTPGAGSLTIAASGGGSGNSVTTTLAFGGSFTDKAQTVVTGQAWVTLTSEITVQVLTPSGTDPDEMRLLDFVPVVSDLVAGTGFTVTLYSESEAKGNYDVMCIGV